MNFPGGGPVAFQWPKMFGKSNVFYTTKSLQLVYPPFDMAHFLVFPGSAIKRGRCMVDRIEHNGP